MPKVGFERGASEGLDVKDVWNIKQKETWLIWSCFTALA